MATTDIASAPILSATSATTAFIGQPSLSPILTTILRYTISGLIGAILGLIISKVIFNYSQRRTDQLAKRLFGELAQTYFCGYTLSDIYCAHFFPRYGKFIDWGFCSAVAALSMLALKQNPTTRYVYADRVGKNRVWHCWVEFKIGHSWYVIDPLWCNPYIITKRWIHYRVNRPEGIKICNHATFWSWPISNQLYDKMQRPETSWLLTEILYTYNAKCGNEDGIFDSEITTAVLPDQIGKRFNPYILVDHQEFIFTRRIMHDMMLNPKRTRPPAHHIRKARRFQRIVRQEYAKYKSEQAAQPQDSASSEPIKTSAEPVESPTEPAVALSNTAKAS